MHQEQTESDEEEETTEDRYFKGDESIQMPPPKRSKSAYLFYTLEKRPEVMEKYPNIDGKEILIKLGKMWRKTSYEDREKFNKMFEDDSERYEKQMREYTKSGKYHDVEGNIDTSQFESRSNSKSVTAQARRKAATQGADGSKHESKTPKKSMTKKEELVDEEIQFPPPRRNISAYTFYTLEKRPEVMEKNPGIDGKDILVRLGKMWKKTGEKEREPYNQKYDEDRKRYERQMLEYMTKGRYYDNEGNIDRSRFFSKRRASSRSVGAVAKRRAQVKG